MEQVSLTALALVCTVKPSPEESSSHVNRLVVANVTHRAGVLRNHPYQPVAS